MIITAFFLVAVGVITALLGAKLFKVLLPLVGLVSGFMVGFIGFQGVFGANAVSTTLAILMALIVGLLLAVLSYVFFDFAVTVFFILLGATAFSYLGIALGLKDDGFVVFLLSVAGAILSGIFAVRYAVSVQLVVTLTAMLGVAYIMTGLMLIVGSVSLNDVHQNGIVPTILRVVDSSFLWFFVWLGGSLVAMQFQYRALAARIMSTAFEYDGKALNSRR